MTEDKTEFERNYEATGKKDPPLPKNFDLPKVCANCRYYSFTLDWTEQQKKIAAIDDGIILLDSDKRPQDRKCIKDAPFCPAVDMTNTYSCFERKIYPAKMPE